MARYPWTNSLRRSCPIGVSRIIGNNISLEKKRNTVSLSTELPAMVGLVFCIFHPGIIAFEIIGTRTRESFLYHLRKCWLWFMLSRRSHKKFSTVDLKLWLAPGMRREERNPFNWRESQSNCFFVLSSRNIQLKLQYLPSQENQADAPSSRLSPLDVKLSVTALAAVDPPLILWLSIQMLLWVGMVFHYHTLPLFLALVVQ